MVTLNLNIQISEANGIKVEHLAIFRCCDFSDSITVGYRNSGVLGLDGNICPNLAQQVIASPEVPR